MQFKCLYVPTLCSLQIIPLLKAADIFKMVRPLGRALCGNASDQYGQNDFLEVASHTYEITASPAIKAI